MPACCSAWTSLKAVHFKLVLTQQVAELVDGHGHALNHKNLPSLRRVILEGDFVTLSRSMVQVLGPCAELEINSAKCWLRETAPGEYGELDTCLSLRVLIVRASTADLAYQFARAVSPRTLARLQRFEIKGDGCKIPNLNDMLARCLARPFRFERLTPSHCVLHFQ
jgi:hypothetical protein